jgi:hypothetical protein
MALGLLSAAVFSGAGSKRRSQSLALISRKVRWRPRAATIRKKERETAAGATGRHNGHKQNHNVKRTYSACMGHATMTVNRLRRQ